MALGSVHILCNQLLPNFGPDPPLHNQDHHSPYRPIVGKPKPIRNRTFMKKGKPNPIKTEPV